MIKKPYLLKVSLHGMNARTQKMMANYLEGTCGGVAKVVEENESEIEIIDADLAFPKSLVDERISKQPSKPIIVLSIHQVIFDNIIYVKKPINIPRIKEALKIARKNLLNRNKKGGEKTSISHVPEFINAKSPLVNPLEINTRLKDLDNTTARLGLSETIILKKGYQRATMRRSFNPIIAKIKSNLLHNSNDDFPVLLLNIDSLGALIKLKKSLQISEEITLEIQFDLQHLFSISARIVRKQNENENENIYGLKFLEPQFELSDYLV